MSQETWNIVQSKKVDETELQLALQCAPLIAGLKISNLLKTSKKNLVKVMEIVFCAPDIGKYTKTKIRNWNYSRILKMPKKI